MPGRGQYYKSKYGGRGRGGGHSQPDQAWPTPSIDGGKQWQLLRATLSNINGQQYGAYKQLLHNQYHHTSLDFEVSFDRVQSDAYAAPSRISVRRPWASTGLPKECLANDIRKIALCDFLTRQIAAHIREKHLDQAIGNGSGGWSGPKGGAFNINAPGQEVLPRTSVMISEGECIELRFTVVLPAAGRTILGREAWQILGVNLVDLITQRLSAENTDMAMLEEWVRSVEEQQHLRGQLKELQLISFVANASRLPRASGAAFLPMDNATVVPFKSPKEAEVTLTGLDGRKVIGMGIPLGITLLTGGGFHGKSTLLEAIELGVYNHIPGDGRERVVTDSTAVKIRAEDGRSVSGVDISPFIANLPGGRETKHFTSEDASGSTSMAANIQEALEAGCKTILIDEDSSATNLLVRDQRMQALIEREPITPLISKARALYRDHGVSTVIVIGGLGDWLSVADNVIVMDSYIPRIATKEAKAVIAKYPGTVVEDPTYGSLPHRSLRIDLSGLRTPYATSKSFISLKPETSNPVSDPSEAVSGIDLSGLDQFVEIGQSRLIATLLGQVAQHTAQATVKLEDVLRNLEDILAIDHCLPAGLRGGDSVAVRKLELVAALSRFRGLVVDR